MTQGQIEEIITRMEAASSIEKKHIYIEMRGATPLVCSEDFEIVGMNENSDGPYLVMYQDDYDFVLHAPDDIRDLVEALEESQKETSKLEYKIVKIKDALDKSPEETF